MFNADEIARVDALLREGVSPEKIAEQMKLSYSMLRHRLLQSGYRIAVRRELETISAVAPSSARVEEEVAA